MKPNSTTPVEGLVNIGKTVTNRLNKIGIHTFADLKKKGAVQAFVEMNVNAHPKRLPRCYYLYSLEGALRGCHWDALTDKQKNSLVKQSEQLGLQKS